MIEELFHEQKLRLLEDRTQQIKIKLLELTGQSEFHQSQLNIQQAELERVESAGAVLAAEIKIISAEIHLIRTQIETREVLELATRNM